MQAQCQQGYGDVADVQEGMCTGARNAGLRMHGGGVFLAMTLAMHLRELNERSGGQMSGQGLVFQFWTELLSSPCSFFSIPLKHQTVSFWGGEGVMRTSIPLILEEAFSCSLFANGLDYPNWVERSSSPAVVSLSPEQP